MSVYIQEVLGLLKRNKKKKKLDKQRDHFEFGKLYHNSSLNTGAAYNPKMEPFVVKFGDLVCEVTEDLTRTQPGSGNVGFVPVYTTPEGSCAWDTLMDSIITQNAVGDTISIGGDLYVNGTITSTALTEDRIVIVGPGGILEDDANFTMDGTTFTANVNVAHGPTTMAPVPPHTTTINSNLFLEGPVYDSLGNMGGLNKVLVGLADGRVKWQDDDVVEALTYGALWQGDPTNYKVELPIGTADQILISDGTTFAWQDNPAAIVGEVCDLYRIPLFTPDAQTLGCSLMLQDGDNNTGGTKVINEGKLQQKKELYLDTVLQDDTLTEVLVRDTGSANEVKFRDVSTIVPPVGFDTLTMSTTADWTQTYLNAYVPLDDSSVAYMRIGGMTGLTDGQEGHVIAENVKTGTLLAQDAIRFPDGWGVIGEQWTNRVSWLTGAGGMNAYKDTDTLLFGESLKFKYINYQAPGQPNNVLFWDACCKLYSKNDCPVGTNQTLTTDEDVAISSQTIVVDDGYGGYGLTYAVVTNVSNGTLAFNSTTGVYTYTPAANFSGTDQFTYTATDGYCTTDPITVTIIVNAVAEPPVWTSSCPDTSSLVAGGTYTYNYTVNDPDHACNQLGVSFTLIENATGNSAFWLTNTYNNDCTGTITGTYPNTGGAYTLTLTVTDPDGNATSQTCNIAGLVPDKDTFFNFWFDTSGSMDDILNIIASNSSQSRIYAFADAGATGSGTTTLQMENNGTGVRRCDTPIIIDGGDVNNWANNGNQGSNSWYLIRPGMTVTGAGIPAGTTVVSTNFQNVKGEMVLSSLHTVTAGTELKFEMTDAMKDADYADVNNLRHTFQDFYATAGTQAGGNADKATNGSDRYDDHVIWCHGGVERPMSAMANRGLGQANNGALDVGPNSNVFAAGADWFFDASQIYMLTFYDEATPYIDATLGSSFNDRANNVVNDILNDAGEINNTWANTDPSVTLRGTFFNMSPSLFQGAQTTPELTPLYGYNGALSVGMSTPIPQQVPTQPAVAATAYDINFPNPNHELKTLYTNYCYGAGANVKIRVYPDTNVGFNHNGYPGVLSDAGTGQFYFNAVKAALADHSVIL